MILPKENDGNFYNFAGNTISLKEHSSFILWEKLVYFKKRFMDFYFRPDFKSPNIEIHYTSNIHCN